MRGQLFLDAESVVVFMEAILLCVVLSSTIVKFITELCMEMGNESKCPTVSCRQEAMSDDQNL